MTHTDAPRVGMGDIQPTPRNITELQTSTAAKYMDDQGHFTAERQALHDEIVKRAMEDVTPENKPRFVMLGGGPASGKSSRIFLAMSGA